MCVGPGSAQGSGCEVEQNIPCRTFVVEVAVRKKSEIGLWRAEGGYWKQCKMERARLR